MPNYNDQHPAPWARSKPASSNVTTKVRDGFQSFTPGVGWSLANAAGDLVYTDGNVGGASYLVISKNPLLQDSTTSLASIFTVDMPVEAVVGLSMSQRTLGQEFAVELVDTGSPSAPVADSEVLTISQVTTTVTVETVTPHGFTVGRAFGIRGCADPRLNYPALVCATVVSPTVFTATAGPGGTVPTLSAYFGTVAASTTAALPAATYANGTAGVGATLTANANGALPAQDGVTLTVGQRLLVKNQAAALENGIYVVTTVGTVGTAWVLTRAADQDQAAELTAWAGVRVAAGTTHVGNRWALSGVVTTVGTTAATYVQVGTGTAAAFAFVRERLGRASDGISQIFEQAVATSASLYIRSAAGDALPGGTLAGNHSDTVGSTAPVALVNGAYQYAFTPTTEYRLLMQSDRTQWADAPVDAVTALTARRTRSQVCPDPTSTYRLRVRAVNAKSLTVPVAQIVSAAKTGSTTATVVTDGPHGLTVADLVVAYGARDQTNFANLATATQVASVVNATTFTVVWGAAVTATTFGGYVARVEGGNLMSALGAVGQSVQSATLATLADGTRQLTLVGSATWAGVSIGDLVNLYGCRDAVNGLTSIGVDGAWKVANLATTALTLVLPYADSTVLPADFASVNCGGGVIKRTDMRLSYVRVFDYERQRVELTARPGTDVMGAVPTQITNTPAVTVSSGTITTVSTVTAVTAVTAAALATPSATAVADVASAALTSTATVAAITPSAGTTYQVNIPVTAVTGTTPTLDVDVEESDDGGTNWYRVWSFPRITAVGMYRSPRLTLHGNRVRYVQTVAGTSPSFTRAINRLQSNDSQPYRRQIIDRSIVLTTLNSTTPATVAAALGMGNAENVQLVVNIGTATTPPALQLEGSDDNGATWYAIGSPLTAVASSSVQVTVANVTSQLVRARVSTAGATVVSGYVLLKAF